ncbi:cupin domain-containing protein [Urbifossiella limnaea]|uniref:Cupin domain protein n=1 Tax=Urbifossiella limnaea TaxID=2528023 RepID=A0A517XXI4_9BACT|nr:cupin domain-containing protein [Urbifossiella limnaea]QDU22163.1 Cupin domain protein [Urbifossiella limnaea]
MTTNLFADLPTNLAAELTQTLAAGPGVRVERIVSQGHASPPGFWYDQDEAEWVLVVRGAARLGFEDGALELRPGDHVTIPAGRRHRVEWTTADEPTVWLAVFFSAGG